MNGREKRLAIPRLYAIIDAALLRGEATAFARQLADAGVQLIQYRNKRASAATLLKITQELVSALRGTNTRLIVNDRPDVAAIAGAGGVHVGQTDLPVADARRLCPRPQWVGISTHNLQQVREAAATSADYIAVGPVFPTATKENPEPVVGIELLSEARLVTAKPLVAIGGITVENARAVYEAGADCVAVARDLMAAGDVALRARQYLEPQT